MTLPSDLAWLAVIGMALITYLTRALPFAVKKAQPSERENSSPALAALGPSLLAAIAVVTVIPGLREAMHTGYAAQLSYLLGVAATLVALRLTRNAGLAVMAGVGAYALTTYCTSLYTQ